MGTGTLEEALAWIEYCRDDAPGSEQELKGKTSQDPT
jgi:hypothetical protein